MLGAQISNLLFFYLKKVEIDWCIELKFIACCKIGRWSLNDETPLMSELFQTKLIIIINEINRCSIRIIVS